MGTNPALLLASTLPYGQPLSGDPSGGFFLDITTKYPILNITKRRMVNAMYSYRTKVEDVKMACVPHALSEVSGLSFGFVLPYCIEYGWNEEIGMYTNKIEECANKLGIVLRCMHPNELGETWSATRLDTSKDYILHTPGHVFAICGGDNRNLNDTHPDKELRTCWEVVKKPGWMR